MEENRIQEVKNRLVSFMEVEKKVLPILERCIEGMEQCCKTINVEKVSIKDFLTVYYFLYLRIHISSRLFKVYLFTLI